MDTSQAILSQLHWIKWSVMVIALSFGAIAGAMIFLSVGLEEALEENTNKTEFRDKASDLLEQGKEQDVLNLSTDRQKTHPKDPNVYWYRAKAQYQLDRLPEALESFRKAEELAPTWRDESTQPFIRAIESKLSDRH